MEGHDDVLGLKACSGLDWPGTGVPAYDRRCHVQQPHNCSMNNLQSVLFTTPDHLQRKSASLQPFKKLWTMFSLLVFLWQHLKGDNSRFAYRTVLNPLKMLESMTFDFSEPQQTTLIHWPAANHLDGINLCINKETNAPKQGTGNKFWFKWYMRCLSGSCSLCFKSLYYVHYLWL